MAGLLVCAKVRCGAVWTGGRAEAEALGWSAFVRDGIVVVVCPEDAYPAPRGWVRGRLARPEPGPSSQAGLASIRAGLPYARP